MTNMTTPSRLNWRNYYTHALPFPVHWQTDFTPKLAFAFTRFRSETSYRSEVLSPLQQLGWTHARLTCAGMTFCGGIMPQEGTVLNSSRRRESLPGVMLTPPLLQVANVLLPACANSVAAPVAPTPPLRRKPMGGALLPISPILDFVAAIFG